MTERRFVYMDHAATTPVDPRVVEAMLPYFAEIWGNASSVYHFASASRAGLDWARETVADILGAKPSEIVFTGCGTESDNLALRGAALASGRPGGQIITTPIEHHAIGHTCDQLADTLGYRVTYLPVDRQGLVDPDDVGRALTEDTVLISVMYANNEVGTIEPLAEIGEIARHRGIPFHTDAVQAGGALDLDVDRLKVDMLSLSGHKFYAPKGVGVLYIREGTQILPTQTGGGQEGHRRAGTENVPYIVGLATGLKLAYDHLDAENARIRAQRDRLVEGVSSRIPDVELTGHPSERLPNSASFVIAGIDGEATLLALDLAGIAASTGSACSAGDATPSHVLTAMGYSDQLAMGSLRLTLGRSTTRKDVDHVLAVLPGVVERLRALSPIYEPAVAM